MSSSNFTRYRDTKDSHDSSPKLVMLRDSDSLTIHDAYYNLSCYATQVMMPTMSTCHVTWQWQPHKSWCLLHLVMLRDTSHDAYYVNLSCYVTATASQVTTPTCHVMRHKSRCLLCLLVMLRDNDSLTSHDAYYNLTCECNQSIINWRSIDSVSNTLHRCWYWQY